MPLLKKIKALKPGERFTFPNGTSIAAEDVVEEEQDGRKVVIMGDTCSGRHMHALAKNADVLIHEATNGFISEAMGAEIGSPAQLEKSMREQGHSTPQMAGSFARQINARQLVLTHFGGRYNGDHSEYNMSLMWRLEDMARETSQLMGPNDVIAAWDLLKLPVFRRNRTNAPAVVPSASTQ
jgi:ribonuclease Z